MRDSDAGAPFGSPSTWTIRSYTEMLNAIQETVNRTFTCDWTQPAKDPTRIYLRHDVDFSLECAVEMAAAEHSIGLRSTYFVEVECPFYNLLSVAAAQQIRQIAAMGHTVGLHLVLPPPGGDAAGDALNSQLGVLVSVLDDALTNIVSLHQPTRHDELAGRLQVATTYDSAFFDPATYLSDSAGRWGSSPSGWIGRLMEHDGPAQLLIHPLWWVESGETPRHKLGRLLDLIASAAERELAHFRAWNEGDQT